MSSEVADEFVKGAIRVFAEGQLDVFSVEYYSYFVRSSGVLSGFVTH